MAATWTITALSKSTKVPSATLRYWEHLGLLPRAVRTHTGYRLFASEALQYVEFVRKSRAMGLSLRQMRRVLELARSGHNPCPEVEQWIRQRLVKLREQIRQLQALEERLRVVSRGFSRQSMADNRCGELCSLIVGLPEEKRFRERGRGEPSCADNHRQRCETTNVPNPKRNK